MVHILHLVHLVIAIVMPAQSARHVSMLLVYKYGGMIKGGICDFVLGH